MAAAPAATTPSPPAPVVIRTPGAIANPPSSHGMLIGPGAWTSTHLYADITAATAA